MEQPSGGGVPKGKLGGCYGGGRSERWTRKSRCVSDPRPGAVTTYCFMGLGAEVGSLLRLGLFPAELADACLTSLPHTAPHTPAQHAHGPDPKATASVVLLSNPALPPGASSWAAPACLMCLGVAAACSGNSPRGPCPAWVPHPRATAVPVLGVDPSVPPANPRDLH